MNLPFAGEWTVSVQAARTFSIHGDLYYEIQAVRTDGPTAGPMVLRMPQHAAVRPPAAGDTLRLTFLMGQVTSAKHVE